MKEVKLLCVYTIHKCVHTTIYDIVYRLYVYRCTDGSVYHT